MAHRTALITAGLLAAVVFAGAIAVGANLGILNVADSRPVGKLSAATAVPAGAATAGKVVHQYAGAQKAAPSSQKYVIKKAGTVEVTVAKGGVRLVDVKPLRHWTWSLTQTADKKLTVTFRHGTAVYTFLATLGPHNAVVARVDHPVTKTVTLPSSGGTSGYVATTLASAAPSAPARSGGDDGQGNGGGGGADD